MALCRAATPIAVAMMQRPVPKPDITKTYASPTKRIPTGLMLQRASIASSQAEPSERVAAQTVDDR
jgi:hypothetical protein